MKVLLIWPKGFDPLYTMPLSLGYLKSNLDNNKYEVKILDCALNNISSSSRKLYEEIRKFNPDVVGLTCWSHVFRESLEICRTAKSINKKIVTILGGCHCTSYYKRVISERNVDFVFRGESELSFKVFLEELEGTQNWSKVKGLCYMNGLDIVVNEMEREADLDKINFPDYDFINLDAYLKKGYRLNTMHKRNAPIWVTRGCPYKCSFCTASLQNGILVRKHSIEYLKKWILYLYFKKNIKMINIIDDNFTFDIKYAKKVCKEIIKLNLKDLRIGTPNGIRIQRSDEELLHLMKKAGWETVVIAPESGSVKVLEHMKKNLDPKIILEKVKQIKKAGLKVHGFFIIGYPGETRKDLEYTVKLIRKCHFNFFFLNNFQPLPGTPVYDELVASGEIKDGLLPKNYSEGERVYVPADFKDFNFGKFVLKEYAFLALTNPLNIPYMFRIINPSMVFKKVYSNFKMIIKTRNSKRKYA